MKYHVRAERSGQWWSLQCVEHPGALSQCRRLDQADVIREAIAWVAEAPEDDVEIEVQPVLDADTEALLTAAGIAQRTAQEAAEQASRTKRDVVLALAAAQLPVRDIGTLLGVSHQRAAQLLQRETPSERPA